MRRLYFMVPNVGSAKAIVNELLLARVEERHIHIIAKEGTPMEDLPEAGLAQKSDFVPALERGIAVGGATGVLAGIVAVTFPPAGLALGGGAILATGLAGAGFGAWFSSMIGSDVPNTQIKQYEEAIEKGELLMMVDVPKDRIDEIGELVKKHHPEAEINGTEPTIPAFP
ncbi:DUF1269 domain-containing protein [Nitrosococcus wardiae]|uniref:DUF1269 domain-containing protein n=1 Tax=Nitrosococcus wardiae TaxID=1814290 RepID=A0A4P7BZP9_9GAMM|nr:DUF1269 domain-containing protein [Nitrosococcus wardiae]QBQ55591.1 DUF1269 domain-containing protein [Nitrosococcus wardiae]